jgi:hypothetical protein
MYGCRKLYELRVLFACTRSSLILFWHRHVQYIHAFMNLHYVFHILTVAQELDFMTCKGTCAALPETAARDA